MMNIYANCYDGHNSVTQALLQLPGVLPRKKCTPPLIQALLLDMRYTLEKKRYGVGLAALKIGVSLAIAIIGLKAYAHTPYSQTIIADAD